MTTLALKLLLTPALIGAVSLAGRRWGPAVSGWLVGLPFTSGPITLFLALSHGDAFAAAAAAGTLGGAVTQAVFCWGYAWLALRGGRRWPAALAGSLALFLAATAALQIFPLGLWPLTGLVLMTLALGLWTWPPSSAAPPGTGRALPHWDLPARMLTATVFVVLLTEAAPYLGPHLTGLLAPVPIYASVLAAFAHQLQGPAAAAAVLRGLMVGLFAFMGFYVTLAGLLVPAGPALAFGAAIGAALAIQAGTGWLLQRRPGGQPGGGR